MALRLLPFVPRLPLSPPSPSIRQWPLVSRTSSVLTQSLLPAVTVSLTVPGFLSDIWESILRAVPKKKTSHMKKRHRQMAGKALKDVKNLRTCPGCGQMKRSHILCSHCVKGMLSIVGRSSIHLGSDSSLVLCRYQRTMEETRGGMIRSVHQRNDKGNYEGNTLHLSTQCGLYMYSML